MKEGVRDKGRLFDTLQRIKMKIPFLFYNYNLRII
jgi:hypothetical protein